MSRDPISTSPSLDSSTHDVPKPFSFTDIGSANDQFEIVLDQVEDKELEEIKEKMKQMEEEALQLKEMQNEVEKQMEIATKSSLQSYPTLEEKMEIDTRSVYIGNVDYSTTGEELGSHFQDCGAVVRVTINYDKHSGAPKGYAYIEFAEKIGAINAVALDESLFKGRQLKVLSKRTNLPGISQTRSRSRRPRRGRGFFAYRGIRTRGRSKRPWYSPY
ncbi:hypothetical protein LOD99_5208 [Oopsacas minuta]|uniref:RRM domain-containing protein n=1 Tax=Oopsacas minuta TaxID=111878 RepID=A0AAV7JSM1_9METZ|nr:hypothetical protein LOD99_5208 [Oopsacas minuta]